MALIDEAQEMHPAVLNELAAAVEHHYAVQIRRHQADLFADFDDDLPEF